jgi:TBC1 domain family member 15
MAADEELTFWCFVEFMDRMVSNLLFLFLATDGNNMLISSQKQNFLRDQSGMKKQLLTLQQLIGAMDPELYRHLGRPAPLNFSVLFLH